MDVDADNFEEAFALLEHNLPKSAFVSLDLEMTGINAPGNRVCGGDLPQEQYAKARSVVRRPYNIVQVGICLFQETAPRRFECRPFNIFVFPRPFSEHIDGKQLKAEDYFLGLSASSTLFLAERGLDFNRWICKGVPYVSAEEEETLRKAFSEAAVANGGATGEAAAPDGRGKPELSRPADIALLEETMKKVADFAASGEAEMKLPSVNSFVALVLRQKIAESHPALTVEKRSSPGANWADRYVLNLAEEDKRTREADKRQRILSHMGFRRVWNLLREQRRPVVFHNGLFDLLFMSSAFEAPLPERLVDFKDAIHKQFPVLFDTKVLAESTVLSGSLGSCRSSLPELAAALDTHLRDAAAGGAAADAGTGGTQADVSMDVQATADLSFSLPEGFTSYGASAVGSSAFHTAGFDAYQTGRVFAFFRARLGDMKTLDFMGRVNLMGSCFELCLGQARDRCMHGGIGRHVYDVDSSAVNTKGLTELLKPVLEDGQRKYTFKWCQGGRSLILVIHGNTDLASSSPAEREAVEACLDSLLQQQANQGRLRFRSLDDYIASMESASERSRPAADDRSPAAKRRRLPPPS